MDKRKVKVFKWVKKERKPTEDNKLERWSEKELDYEGLFHSWGVFYDEFDMGAGNFTTAIIEKEDGSIETPEASMIQFIIDTEGSMQREGARIRILSGFNKEIKR